MQLIRYQPVMRQGKWGSRVFVDVKSILGDASEREMLVNTCGAKVCDVSYDVIAGPETGGAMLGLAMAAKARVPFIYVRKQSKTYDRMSILEGYSPPDGDWSNVRVLLVDDFVNTGKTLNDARKELVRVGAQVVATFSPVALNCDDDHLFLERLVDARTMLGKQIEYTVDVNEHAATHEKVYKYKMVDGLLTVYPRLPLETTMGTLYCIENGSDAQNSGGVEHWMDGKLRYTYTTRGLCTCLPSLDLDCLYTGCNAGVAYCFFLCPVKERYKISKHINWTVELGSEIKGTCTLIDDLVVYATKDGRIVALDKYNGSHVWTRWFASANAPERNGGLLVGVTVGGLPYMMDAAGNILAFRAYGKQNRVSRWFNIKPHSTKELFVHGFEDMLVVTDHKLQPVGYCHIGNLLDGEDDAPYIHSFTDYTVIMDTRRGSCTLKLGSFATEQAAA